MFLATIPFGFLAVLSKYAGLTELFDTQTMGWLAYHLLAFGLLTAGFSVVCFSLHNRRPRFWFLMLCAAATMALLASILLLWVTGFFYLIPAYYLWGTYRESLKYNDLF